MNPLRAATIAVADLDEAIDRYQIWLGYGVVERGRLPGAIAVSLDAPRVAGAPVAVLRPASAGAVDLRLIEQPRVAGYRPMQLRLGGARDRHSRCPCHPRENGRKPVRGDRAAGRDLGAADDPPNASRRARRRGSVPDRDKEGGAGSGLPIAEGPIDTLFIAVLACRDLADAAAWVAGRLGASVAPAIEIPYGTINRAFGLPEGTDHALVTGERDVHFRGARSLPPAATERPDMAGWLRRLARRSGAAGARRADHRPARRQSGSRRLRARLRHRDAAPIHVEVTRQYGSPQWPLRRDEQRAKGRACLAFAGMSRAEPALAELLDDFERARDTYVALRAAFG